MWIIAIISIGVIGAGFFALRPRPPLQLPTPSTIAEALKDIVDGKRVSMVGQVVAMQTVMSPLFGNACVAYLSATVKQFGRQQIIRRSSDGMDFYLFDDTAIVKIKVITPAATLWLDCNRVEFPDRDPGSHEILICDTDLLWVSGEATSIVDPQRPIHPADKPGYRDDGQRMIQISSGSTPLIFSNARERFGGAVVTNNPKRIPRLQSKPS
jgi:hypothetical protein